MRIAILSICMVFLPPSCCFSSCLPHRRLFGRAKLFSESNGSAEPTSDSLHRRERFVDFPSFAYDTDKKYDSVNFKDLTGNVDTVVTSARRTRLLKNRAYARSELFKLENIAVPPTLKDLSPPPFRILERFPLSTAAQLLSFYLAFISFPFLTHILGEVFNIGESQLNEILQAFAPGISILYGTFISLTISTLYNRQRTIQDNLAVECSLLTTIMRNLLSLFRTDEIRIVMAGQSVADQIRTLVRSSRGEELMLLMYNDPYARMLELVDEYESELMTKNKASSASPSSSLTGICRDTIRELTKYRALRLSDEALALPPTHFSILNILTTLILLGFAVSVIPTLDPVTGDPPVESSILFGALASTYILFFNFATDLDDPFQGIYQVRRSCAAGHLLEAKWVIANHPSLRGQVDFEEVQEEEDGAVMIRSPGLGDFWFQREDIYLKEEQQVDDEFPPMRLP